MLQEPQTWRELLDRLDAQEKQTLIKQLGIDGKTLKRWIRGQTGLPHQETIRQLLTVLPRQQRTRFAELLQQDPGFVWHTNNLLFSRPKMEIPSTFYARIMETNASTSENFRFTALCQLILNQVLKILDADALGLCITIFVCTPPFQQGKVRSLFRQFSRGTRPWGLGADQTRSFFAGAESLVGQAVINQKPIVFQNAAGGEASPHLDAHTVSLAAHPMLQATRIAGAVFTASTQPDFFTPNRLKILSDYCHLLVIAFREETFYIQEHLALGTMPAIATQQQYLDKVLKRTIGANRTLLSEWVTLWSKTEQDWIHQIESDLLAMASQPEMRVTDE